MAMVRNIIVGQLASSPVDIPRQPYRRPVRRTIVNSPNQCTYCKSIRIEEYQSADPMKKYYCGRCGIYLLPQVESHVF